MNGHIDPDKLLMILNHLRSRIVKILYDKCMFYIPEDRIAGLCWQNPVTAAPGFYHPSENAIHLWSPSCQEKQLLEIDYTGILAHELTHCWQFVNQAQFSEKLRHYNYDNVEDEANIPHEGKLILEGCANWGQYKVLDYFAADELIRRLAPDMPSQTTSGMMSLFKEYRDGFLLMLHLEYHCDFARLLYFLQTGELVYAPMGALEKWRPLRTARDYEKQLYPDGRLGIDSPMAQIPENWGESDGLCVRQAGYASYDHTTRGLSDYVRDYPRLTYLKPRIEARRDKKSTCEVVDDSGATAAAMGAFQSGVSERTWQRVRRTVDELLSAAGQQREALHAFIKRELKLCCTQCKFAKLCTVFDACHLHSCGKPDRSATALVEKLLKKCDDLSRKEEAPQPPPEFKGQSAGVEPVADGQAL
ncbi:MAG: hypothetical protein WCN95_11055 [bacterium]